MSTSEGLKPTGQLLLQVTICVDPSDIERFMTALRPVWKACIDEPQNLYFDVSHSPTEPGTFRFVEVWTGDQKWFEEVQLNKEYYAPYLDYTRPMWTKERVMIYSERMKGWSSVTDEYLQGSLRG